jgi:hypothetical protein
MHGTSRERATGSSRTPLRRSSASAVACRRRITAKPRRPRGPPRLPRQPLPSQLLLCHPVCRKRRSPSQRTQARSPCLPQPPPRRRHQQRRNPCQSRSSPRNRKTRRLTATNSSRMRSRSCSAPTAATNKSKHVKAAAAKPAESKPVEKPLEAQPVKSATPAPAPAVVSSAANESTPATYTDCDEFKPHAFKKDKCSNCGYAKDKHRPEATPEGKELVKAPVEPPKPAAREPVAAATTVPPKAPAKEQQPAATASAPPKPTLPAAEGPSSDTDCTDFKPHPFRKQMCANCGHTQASHTAPKAPVAAVLKPAAPTPGGTEQAGVPAPAAPGRADGNRRRHVRQVRTARLQEAPV